MAFDRQILPRYLAAFAITALAHANLLPASQGEAAPTEISRRAEVGDVHNVTVELEVGGSLIVADESGKEHSLPLKAEAKLAYSEELLTAPAPKQERARSLRRYHNAVAAITTNKREVIRKLQGEETLLVAEIADGVAKIQGLDRPLTREEFDLVNVVGNSLALDLLLPNKTLAEGESWKHDSEAIATWLGVEEIESCEVSSVVDEVDSGGVQLRMAGAVQGRIDGASATMELKGAYLYDKRAGQITKFNLAVKEQRKPGPAAPGLDVVAKLTLVRKPATESDAGFTSDEQNRARSISFAGGELIAESPQRAFRFRHSAGWYVTADQRELLSLRLLRKGKFIAHCNVSALSTRSPERAPRLEQFQRDIRTSLADNLDKVVDAKEWRSGIGHRCMAVFVNGKVKDIPVQWRYYQLAADDGRRASVTVTVEQSLLEKFDDA
ncbi:hypothetical protein OAS39_03215, partial [Pirellulales bacterium]|nr:hypothetical protein [Pirellulales bacterium]